MAGDGWRADATASANARSALQGHLPEPAHTPKRSRQTRASQGVASQAALPVPTSFQFGSRELVSRANVQTSVISATLSGLPSTVVPVLSRVTEGICDSKQTVFPFFARASRDP